MRIFKKFFYISAMISILGISTFAGVSLEGPTGFLNVPSPETLEPNTFEGGVHYQSYGFGGNTNYNIVSIKGNVGISENVEVGIEKTTDSGTLSRDPGMVINAKAKWSISDDINMAGGVIVDTTSGNYSSVYGLVGADIAFFGMGFNFGGEKGLPYSTARMGGYDLTDIAPDKVFFLAGAKFQFGESGALTVSYNGDAVGLGFCGEIDDTEGMASTVEVGWIIEGDYEDLYEKYLNPKYDKNRLTIGISGKF